MASLFLATATPRAGALAFALAMTCAAGPAPASAADAAPPPAAEAWTLAVAAQPGAPRHAVAAAFAACVRDASVGKLTLAPEPAPEPKGLAAAVLAGTPRLAAVPLADVPDPDPLFGLATIAYLAPDYKPAEKLWTAARLDLDRTLAARGFALIYGASLPPAGLFLRGLPADGGAFMRLRLAAPTDAGARLLVGIGLEPIALADAADIARLAAAMAVPPADADALDGFAAEADAAAAAVVPAGAVFLDLRALLPRELVVANRTAFDALNADAKTALIACGDKATGEAATAAQAEDTAGRAALVARGITVLPPPDTLRAEITAYGDSRLADWLRRTGVAGKAILDSFRAM